MGHGTFNNKNKFYNVLIQKCEQQTLNEIYKNENMECKNISEIEDNYKNGNFYFNFIDQIIDMTKYKNPVIKYFYRIKSKLDKDHYSINNFNFNPSAIATNDGIIKDNIKLQYSYQFDNNNEYIYRKENNNIYASYYIWINNRMNYYYRIYSKFDDLISYIGGVSQVIISCLSFINKFFNGFNILKDTDELLSSNSISLKQILSLKKDIKTINLKQKNNDINKSCCSLKQAKSNILMIDKNKNILNNKHSINNTFIKQNIPRYELTDIVTKKENDIIENNNVKKTDKFSIFKYLFNQMSCGRVNKEINLYEEFRIKIICVENILKISLNVENLLEIMKIKKI